SLDPESRAGLAAFHTEALRYPAGHPLRTAAEQGEEALYRAIDSGAGDVEIVDTVGVPRVEPSSGRAGLRRRADGTFELPAARGGAVGRAGSTTLRGSATGGTGAAETAPLPGAGRARQDTPIVQPGEVERSGEHSTRAEMLNGFTRGRVWEW